MQEEALQTLAHKNKYTDYIRTSRAIRLKKGKAANEGEVNLGLDETKTLKAPHPVAEPVRFSRGPSPGGGLAAKKKCLSFPVMPAGAHKLAHSRHEPPGRERQTQESTPDEQDRHRCCPELCIHARDP